MLGKLLSYDQHGQSVTLSFEQRTMVIEALREEILNVFVSIQSNNRYSKAVKSDCKKQVCVSVKRCMDCIEVCTPKVTAKVYETS
ncbi:MAG: DUF4968 domain-containing protein [Clostridiales bacterium]|nr:DUF4968 domain-containing protein [Clostridiales bacterium]